MFLTFSRFFFFFNDTATTKIYTLSLHDALPISDEPRIDRRAAKAGDLGEDLDVRRSEEYTSELQSRVDLVCRLLLEKKKSSRLVVATWAVGRGDGTEQVRHDLA